MRQFLLVIVILMLGCNQTSTKKVNENNLKTFFTSRVKEIDSTMIVEKFTLVKLDTTTLKNQYTQLFNRMFDKSEENNYDLKLLIEKIKTTQRLQSLSSDLSYKLYKNYKDDADEDIQKAKDLLFKDSLLKIDLQKVDTLLSHADSVKPVFYRAKCFYTIRKKDQSVSKDTTYIRLDLEYNILDNTEYAKHLNNLYKPISNFKYE